MGLVEMERYRAGPLFVLLGHQVTVVSSFSPGLPTEMRRDPRWRVWWGRPVQLPRCGDGGSRFGASGVCTPTPAL